MRVDDFRRVSLAAYAAVAAAAAAVRLGWVTLSGMAHALPLCLFKAVTGLPCPGCGMAHALILGMNGRWAESFAAHPLGLPVLAVWTASLLAPRRLPSPRGASAAAVLGLVLGVYAARLSGAL